MNTQDIVQEIESLLQKVNFPADKQTLIDEASKTGVGQEILGALKQLPEQKFQNPEEVVSQVSMNQASSGNEEDDATGALDE